jgi:hypothetical protein
MTYIILFSLFTMCLSGLNLRRLYQTEVEKRRKEFVRRISAVLGVAVAE